ncbi:MAG: protein arginine kinase [Verrucomicrobia bacterium]|nr:MAG: protein arginine kinase [Verrucomicrobiota bacterium]
MLEELFQQPCAWLQPGADTGTVVSSRIRLARNLKDAAFPGWAGEEECERIWQKLRPVLSELKSLEPSFSVGMAEVEEFDRLILFERHLISGEMTQRGRGSGLVAGRDETISAMVNEEDHLRLQCMSSGLTLQNIWKRMDALDSEIEARVRYAFSPRLGYLTACPTNVGTGLRASVMLHLPGLALMNELNPVAKGLTKIGLAVRGLWGEGTEAAGNMFQISNQITLGDREENIVRNIEQIVLEVVEHEKNARARLLEKRELVLRDHVGRAWGILSHAHLLSSKEALDLLSGLRLGIDLRILSGVDRQAVDRLLLLSQPAHLQRREGKMLKPKDRDRVRAELIRTQLAGLRGSS